MMYFGKLLLTSALIGASMLAVDVLLVPLVVSHETLRQHQQKIIDEVNRDRSARHLPLWPNAE